MKMTLTPEQITKVWRSMPGGYNRFMKDWGYQTLAKALLEEANRNPAPDITPESIGGDSLNLALRHRAVGAGFRSVSDALDFAIAHKSTAENTQESSAKEPQSTPPNRWAEEGESDPHGTSYDCERAALALGKYTDDELANGAFMNYDQPMNIKRVMARDPDYHTPIAWMTGVKDRIRWLSRALTNEAKYSQDLRVALLACLRELTELNARFYRDGEWPAVTIAKAALALGEDK